MARTCRPLTALDIKQCAVGTYAVGGATGLYFRKNKSQSLFFLRYTDETGRHDLSLGQYPALTLPTLETQIEKKASTDRQ